MKKVFCILALAAVPVTGMADGNHNHGKPQGGGQPAMHGMHHGSGDGAVGRPGDPAKVARTIEIVMGDDLRFTPAQIKVKAGETIRFFLRNTGKTEHELVIGSMAELKEHADMMRAHPDMKHDEPNMARVAPGKRGGLVWQFTKAGTVDFACLLPGHFEGGMRGQVRVE